VKRGLMDGGRRRLGIYLLGWQRWRGRQSSTRERSCVYHAGSLAFPTWRSKAAAWPGGFAGSIHLKGNWCHNPFDTRRGRVKEDNIILVLKVPSDNVPCSSMHVLIRPCFRVSMISVPTCIEHAIPVNDRNLPTTLIYRKCLAFIIEQGQELNCHCDYNNNDAVVPVAGHGVSRGRKQCHQR
jgi:hypothetical protein